MGIVCSDSTTLPGVLACGGLKKQCVMQRSFPCLVPNWLQVLLFSCLWGLSMMDFMPVLNNACLSTRHHPTIATPYRPKCMCCVWHTLYTLRLCVHVFVIGAALRWAQFRLFAMWQQHVAVCKGFAPRSSRLLFMSHTHTYICGAGSTHTRLHLRGVCVCRS